MLQEISADTARMLEALLPQVQHPAGSIFVLGASSSEIQGVSIGKAGSPTVAETVLERLMPALTEKGFSLAVQCCEHLNRALVVEEALARAKGLPLVAAVPQPAAGGAFAAVAWQLFESPVLVESLVAQAGLDIGGTLIGMHLAHVAVPIRLADPRIGAAHVLAATTRAKYIGGPRTLY